MLRLRGWRDSRRQDLVEVRRRAVERGRLAEQLLGSQGWNEIVLPLMEALERQAREEWIKDPLAGKAIVLAGKAQGLAELRQQIGCIVQAGTRAHEELAANTGRSEEEAAERRF